MVATIPFYADPYKETVLILGGPKGLVLVSEVADVEIELENEFDTQRRKGHNAARPKFLGIKPAEIDVEFIVMPDEEEAFFRDVVPILRAKAKNGNSPPLDILNHQANRLGINTVILKRSKIGKPDAREGRHVSIKLQEWTPGTVDPAKTKAKQQNTLPPGIEPVNVFTNQ
jgi:hypothetical protein